MFARTAGLAGFGASVLIVGGSPFAGPAQADTLYNIKDLTPTGYSTSVAFDINGDGDAVGIAGTFATGSLTEAYFYYDHSAGTSTVFGVGTVLPRDTPFGSGFREAAVNDDGLVVGTARFVGGVNEVRGFIYSPDANTFTNLGTLAGATPSNIRPVSDAMDINSTGLAVGTATSGAGTVPQENDNIDVYTGTASPITDIDGDITVATRFDRGRAINNAGQIAGSNQDGKATLFTATGVETELLTGTGYAAEASHGIDLNELGQVAVNATGSNDALIYNADGSVTVIPQIGGGNRMNVKGINESGDAVGQGDRTAGLSGQARGYFYDASAGASVILEDRVVDKSIPAETGLSDWGILRTAWAVNDDGWIVGEGERRFTGNAFPTDRAYLLIPEAFGTGDYNASGQVEQGDLDLVLQNWGTDTTPGVGSVPTGWINDLPVGQIEQTELDKVLQNWGSTNAPSFDGASVPEPAGLAMLALAGAAVLRRR